MVPIVVSRPLTSLLAAREPFRSFPPALERQVIWERRPCSRLQRPPNPPMPRNRKCCSDGGGVALAGATGGGLIGSGCQRGGGAERVARSRGGAAAARAAWVGYGFHPFRGAAQHAAGADRAIALARGGGRACG